MVTYNHERYIRQALDSVLMQKVNFKYEIVIGDDCSPDNTQDIIREYTEKYSDIIKPVLRQKNIGAPNNGYDINKRCKGKYIATLEGDDYWTDDDKLQTQVDFLERHPKIFSVAHRVQIVDINGIHQCYDHEGEQLDRYFNKDDALKYKASLYRSSSLMHRNFFRDSNDKYVIFRDSNKNGAHLLGILFLATMSDIYIMERPMSVWRRVVEANGTNYTSMAARNPIDDNINQLVMYINFRNFFKNQYDFNYSLREKFITCIYFILKSDIEIERKFKKIMKLFNRLELKDIMALPVVAFRYIISRIKSKYLS